MFKKSTAFNDAIYSAMGKDYALEAQRLQQLSQKNKLSQGNRLLDVASVRSAT